MVDLGNGTRTDSHFQVTDDVMGQGVTSGLLTDITIIMVTLAVGNADVGTGLHSRTVGPAIFVNLP